MDASASVGTLTSLRKYEALRANATSVYRPEESLVDVVIDNETGEEVILYHLVGLLPFHRGDYAPFFFGFDDSATIALAVQMLNTGDGVITPEIEGLNERCKIRFTFEMADSEWNAGYSLKKVTALTGRDPTGPLPLPGGFVGPYLSSASVPTSVILGTYGYPQMSPGAVAAELDDKSLSPLFGRTVPSAADQNLPLILFFKNALQIEHLVFIYRADTAGISFAENFRKERDKNAPNLDIRFISLDSKDGAFASVVETAKSTGFGYIFAYIFDIETHDALMTEAFQQGIAGTGLHNWMFGIASTFLFGGRSLEKGSPLHLAYRGTGIIQFSSGFEGLPTYDIYSQRMAALRNSVDLDYLASKFPKYDQWETTPFVDDPDYLIKLNNGYNPNVYESAIALGLSACNALSSDKMLSGEDQVQVMRNTAFRGISGNMVWFNNVTGSRDPNSALFMVTNFVEREADGMITLEPVLSYLFQDSEWNVVEPYIFNDGTTNFPVDILFEASTDEFLSRPVLLTGSFLILIILGFVYMLIREHRNKRSDMAWQVKKEELRYDTPPKVLGVGTFGQVILANYRGTSVAVKRVLPPQQVDKTLNVDVESGDSTRDSTQGMESGRQSKGIYSIKSGAPAEQPKDGVSKRTSPRNIEALKKDFLQEMRLISTLRHPCIVTIMGSVKVKGEEPLLVMELMELGSLYDILHNDTMALDGEVMLPILRDISQGINFLHSADPKIIHGDLKAANVLVDSRHRGKVSDFGLSQKKKLHGRNHATGTPFWMAPELLRGETSNTVSSDVFSFGVILYEVYSRKDPYEGEREKDVLLAIMDKAIQKRVLAPKYMPPPIKLLMEDCFEENPEERPPFEEIDRRLKRISAETATVSQPTSKSQVSLFDIFPRHIATALRDGRKVDAEHKDCVTIFFSDIVGFTSLSSKLDPRKVANMLDRLYIKLDRLSHKHDLYKVETIGDAFMCVGGLVKDQPLDHCKRVALFALEAIQAANSTMVDEEDPSLGYINIRVGFHSGPVVADVVGERNPRYCLFGDTVNTASRMESSSEANRINCSYTSAEILREQCPELVLIRRGEISIKGKGLMNCFFVEQPPRLEEVEGSRPKQAEEDLSDLEDSLRNRLNRVRPAS